MTQFKALPLYLPSTTEENQDFLIYDSRFAGRDLKPWPHRYEKKKICSVVDLWNDSIVFPTWLLFPLPQNFVFVLCPLLIRAHSLVLQLFANLFLSKFFVIYCNNNRTISHNKSPRALCVSRALLIDSFQSSETPRTDCWQRSHIKY